MSEQPETFGVKAREVLLSIGWHMLTPSECFIDWDLATSLAFDFAGVSDKQLIGAGEQNRKEFVQIYRNIIDYIGPLISEYVETPWPQKVDPVLIFDRAEWIVINIENLKSFLLPLSQDYWEALDSYLSLSYPIGRKIVKKASEISITSELGFLMGYLSRKVLAQYDFGLPKADGVIPSELFYFVEPNILGFEHRFNLDPLNVRLWIALHEATHSFQFKAFPWLRDYIHSLLQDYLRLIDGSIKTFKNEVDGGAVAFSWGASWWKNLLSSEHREMIRKIQALMCIIEGYSEHVMMQVGKKFPHCEEIMDFFKERRKRKTLAEQMLEKLIGFDLKIKQYAIGEKFAAYVADSEGIKFLNKVWQSKDHLPTYNEVFMPGTWIKRMKSSGQASLTS